MRSTVLSLVAFATLVATACGDGPKVDAATTTALDVQVARVTAVELPQHIESGGVVRARNTALIASRVMAPIAAVHVRPGDRVRRGAPLVTLDARESMANSTHANAAFAAAAEAARAADADVHAADAQLRLARATHARISTLYEKRSATPQELDQAVAALRAAEANVSGARARAMSAAAARDAASAARDAAGVGASYAVLSAPFDGVIVERTADAGSMAAPGIALLVIEDPTLARIEVLVDEARAAALRVGQLVEYRLDHVSGSEWHPARVSEVGRVDPASHSFVVKVDLPDAHAPRSGSFARVRFAAGTRRTLVVPSTAVIRRGQLTMVFSVDAEARARLRSVSTGLEAGDLVEILAGVAPDDTVVVLPPPGLMDGTPVMRP